MSMIFAMEHDDIFAAAPDYQRTVPSLLDIRSSKWTIGITAFVATFTVGSSVPLLTHPWTDSTDVV